MKHLCLSKIDNLSSSIGVKMKHSLCRLSAIICAVLGVYAITPQIALADIPTVTQINYDAGDHVTSVTDPRGLITYYTYDGLGQLWQLVSPDTGTTTYGYDGYGRYTSLTRADGTTTTYGYDSLSRVVSLSAGGQTQVLAYDTCTNGIGRLCTLSDSTSSTSYTYTPEGWLTGRGFSIAGTTYALGYNYDAVGQVTAVNYPDGNQATYSYTNGVVSGVQVNVGGNVSNAASSITYQPGDVAMAQWTSSNGITNILNYDSDGRLTGISAGVVQSLGLSYDTANRISSITNGIDGTMTQSFGYDSMSHLTLVNSGADNESFQYDANGNRTSQVVNGTSNTVGTSTTNNQVTGLSGGSNVSYGYDPNGNLTTVSGTPTFTYNPFNRLVAANGATYYVNPEGRRLEKTVNGSSTFFAPGGSGSLMAENQGVGWIDYVWLNGRLIGRLYSGQTLAVHDDQVGRPEAMTDTSQTVVWRARNFAFDRVVTVNNSVPLNLGFPGQYYDAESGTWNNGFRDYGGSLGRYLQSDPKGLGGGINTYAYALDNPGLAVDPYGLESGYFSLYSSGLIDHLPEDGGGRRGPDYVTVSVSYPPFLVRSYTLTRTGTLFEADGAAISDPTKVVDSFYPKNWKLGFNLSMGMMVCQADATAGAATDNFVNGASYGVGAYDGIGGGYSVNSSGQAIETGIGLGGGSAGRTDAAPVGTLGSGW